MNTLQQQLQKLNIIPEEKEWSPIPEVEKRIQGFNQALSSINYDLLEQFFKDRFIEMVEKMRSSLNSDERYYAFEDILTILKNYKNNK